MKHAYLILAHNEFELLSLLISALDDVRNDIYVHFDKKVKQIPLLSTKHAQLRIIDDRIDVRWADRSMVEAEYALFQSAIQHGPYKYYHLLSGVDLPIKSQDYIHGFFERHDGKEFVGFYQGEISDIITYRVRKIHLYPRYFRERKGFFNLYRRIVRRAFLILQSAIGFKRNRDIEFKKGTQWISITEDFVRYLLTQKESVLDTYRNTFCSDELFVQTLCWASSFKDNIYDSKNEGRGSLRYIGWQDGELIDFDDNDYEEIVSSEALFARKFSGKNINLVQCILKYIQK